MYSNKRRPTRPKDLYGGVRSFEGAFDQILDVGIISTGDAHNK